MRASFSFSFSLLLLLAFLLSSSASHHCANAQTLIQITCENDPNIDLGFCTTSLQAAPASQCAGIRGLGKISIRLVRYNVTDTRCHVKQLLKNKKLDPDVKSCLHDCLELYSDAIPSVKQAMKYYNSKRFVDASKKISSVMDAAMTCEDGFGENNGVVSPLTKRNNDTLELSAMVLSIMLMIQNASH